MPYQPVDYGNALLKAEQINALRARNDPNSLNNQILAEKLNQLKNPSTGQFGGIDPTAQMKNDQYRNRLIEQGATKDDIARFDNWVARQWIGDVGNVPTIVRGNEQTPLGTLEGEMTGEGAVSYAGEAGKQFAQSGRANPYAPVQPGDINLNVGQAQPAPPSAASLAGEKAAATEEAKLEQQFKWKSIIASKVKLAEAEAKERGEVLTDLKRMEATLPGLRASIKSLKKLNVAATHTTIGKGWNTIVREMGFGATEGATARAQFLAIVDNQILPLLRQTFGAAFTAEEGDRLRATMGNINLSPEERNAQLDAFIAQKVSDVQSKKRQLREGNTDETYEQRRARILGQ